MAGNKRGVKHSIANQITPEFRKLVLDKGLAYQDFLDCALVRRHALIDDYASWLKGKSVLELGSHVGINSAGIFRFTKNLVMIENNPLCVKILKKIFGKKVKVIEGDVHHELWKLKPGSFDVVICAGILYHSAYPHFMLEGIARLRPKRLLMDSLLAPDGKLIALFHADVVNKSNYRYNHGPDCASAIMLGEVAIDTALRNLNFTDPKTVSKSGLSLPDDQDSTYFQLWKSCYSKWWTFKA